MNSDMFVDSSVISGGVPLWPRVAASTKYTRTGLLQRGSELLGVEMTISVEIKLVVEYMPKFYAPTAQRPLSARV